MYSIKRYCVAFIVLFVFGFQQMNASCVFAQVNSSGLSISTPVIDTELSNGDLICTYTDQNRKCDGDYDPAIYGIVTENPAIAITDEEMIDSKYIITSGIAEIKVSTIGGSIEEGDFITSSTIPGVAQKAGRSGYVVGIAMENYTADSIDAIETIQIMINIHPAASVSGQRGNILQYIREGAAVPIFSPLESFRYLLAILIIVISFTLGLMYFGRTSRAGIEAIGRNPLAKRVIQLTVMLNIGLTLIIILVGLAIAYLVLVL